MSQLHDYQLEEMFDNMLDECYDDIDICGCRYRPSRTLREVDPVAYREFYNNWFDSYLTDGLLFEHSDGSIHDEEEKTDDEQPA